jgi:hypothetical protein
MYKVVKAHDKYIILKAKTERRWLFKVVIWHMIDENYQIINYPCTVKIHDGYLKKIDAVKKINKLNGKHKQNNK